MASDEYAGHYKHGAVQTAEKIEDVAVALGRSPMIDGGKIADVSHALKYFDRAGLKEDYGKDIFKCADWLHRLITGKFLNEVGGAGDED